MGYFSIFSDAFLNKFKNFTSKPNISNSFYLKLQAIHQSVTTKPINYTKTHAVIPKADT